MIYRPFREGVYPHRCPHEVRKMHPDRRPHTRFTLPDLLLCVTVSINCPELSAHRITEQKVHKSRKWTGSCFYAKHIHLWFDNYGKLQYTDCLRPLKLHLTKTSLSFAYPTFAWEGICSCSGNKWHKVLSLLILGVCVYVGGGRVGLNIFLYISKSQLICHVKEQWNMNPSRQHTM